MENEAQEILYLYVLYATLPPPPPDSIMKFDSINCEKRRRDKRIIAIE